MRSIGTKSPIKIECEEDVNNTEKELLYTYSSLRVVEVTVSTRIFVPLMLQIAISNG